MPTNFTLNNIIIDTAGYSAAYRPASSIEDGKFKETPRPPECKLPDLVGNTVTLSLPILSAVERCATNFVPPPIIPPPFIPPDLVAVCESFDFKSGFTGTTTNLSFGNYDTTNDTTTITGINHADFITGSLPEIELQQAITEGQDEVVAGRKYVVVASGGGSVTYNNQTYVNGQYFVGINGVKSFSKIGTAAAYDRVGLVAVSPPANSAITVRGDYGTKIRTLSGAVPYKARYLTITSDNRLPTEANLNFSKTDQNGCAGIFQGNINIPTPCQDGFTFDTRYDADYGEYISYAINTASVSREHVDNPLFSFEDIIPHNTNNSLPLLYVYTNSATTIEAGKVYRVYTPQDKPNGYVTYNGVNYTHKQYVVYTGTDVISAKVDNAEIYLQEDARQVTSVNPVNGNIEEYITIASGYTHAKSSLDRWVLERISVTANSGLPTSGRFEFINDSTCGGKFIGNINVASVAPACSATSAATPTLEFKVLNSPNSSYSIGSYNNTLDVTSGCGFSFQNTGNTTTFTFPLLTVATANITSPTFDYSGMPNTIQLKLPSSYGTGGNGSSTCACVWA